jgi:hypothetical protein
VNYVTRAKDVERISIVYRPIRRDTVLIAHLTDLHVRPAGMPANRIVETNMLSERALRALAAYRPQPDIVVISGDLTENGLEAEYVLVADMLRRHISVPVFVVPGNHDRRGPLRAGLGHLPGVAADPHFIQYAVEGYPVRLIMLDTVVPGAGHGELCADRLNFLDRTLQAMPTAPTVVVMHHPPIVCGIAHMDTINLRDSAGFSDVIARHAQVERILCGHHHRPIVGRVAHAIVSVAPSVAHQVELALEPGAPGAMVMEPPAFQLHLWRQESGIVSHTAYVEGYPGPFPFQVDPDYPGGSI